MSFPPAPSAPPKHVNVSELTSSSITVQWGSVDCSHHNGNITGYSVRYAVQGSGNTQARGIAGGSATEVTISELDCGATYSIEVAAVNSAGTGVYSNALSVIMEGIVFI